MPQSRSQRRRSRRGGANPAPHEHTGQILGVVVGLSGLFFTAYELGKSAGQNACEQQHTQSQLDEVRRLLNRRG